VLGDRAAGSLTQLRLRLKISLQRKKTSFSFSKNVRM